MRRGTSTSEGGFDNELKVAIGYRAIARPKQGGHIVGGVNRVSLGDRGGRGDVVSV